jgi:hypothetical protein
MSSVAFLIDECVPASFFHGMQSRAPYIQAQMYCEEHELALISTDYRTLPDHVLNHVLRGRHTWGVFILRPGIRFDVLLDDLLLIHGTSDSEDWIDQIFYLPL